MSDPAIYQLRFSLFPIWSGELALVNERDHRRVAGSVDRNVGVLIPGSTWSVAKIKRAGK